MMFCLRLKMRADRAANFHLWLFKAGRQIGITPTGMANDSDDVRPGDNQNFQVYSFTFQAGAALTPKQLVTLFTECERIGAVILGIEYREQSYDDNEGEEAGNDASWTALSSPAKGTGDAPIVIRRKRVAVLPPRLTVLEGGRDDSKEE